MRPANTLPGTASAVISAGCPTASLDSWPSGTLISSTSELKSMISNIAMSDCWITPPTGVTVLPTWAVSMREVTTPAIGERMLV